VAGSVSVDELQPGGCDVVEVPELSIRVEQSGDDPDRTLVVGVLGGSLGDVVGRSSSPFATWTACRVRSSQASSSRPSARASQPMGLTASPCSSRASASRRNHPRRYTTVARAIAAYRAQGAWLESIDPLAPARHRNRCPLAAPQRCCSEQAASVGAVIRRPRPQPFYRKFTATGCIICPRLSALVLGGRTPTKETKMAVFQAFPLLSGSIRVMGDTGLEPVTSALSRRRSPS
jgi:hypothetical protein